MKVRIAAARMPGAESGRTTRVRVAQRLRAEVGRGFEQARIQALECRVQWQHDERQVRVDQAEDHRAVVVEQRQRVVDQAELFEAPC